jgi:hypothetical protein
LRVFPCRATLQVFLGKNLVRLGFSDVAPNDILNLKNQRYFLDEKCLFFSEQGEFSHQNMT